DVSISIGHLGMANIGTQRENMAIDLHALRVPVFQSMTDERVTLIELTQLSS
ncbi:MAG: hypothetical protein JWO52_1318, partial [Gammaproteobacteria bacterium]|nr:hypothetical protein [Gammaproteobacteria bacterium]